ncbi:hypothetical protein BGZ63DRAFT_473706 [Mariannaea sp. PMI_226]|nr:hypothetical protein BGZ63DRAFT_473706 [Mariannaea sp. PMI_226]
MACSPKLEFFTIDVFTDTKFLGNPLAVVIIPDRVRSGTTQETKQRIAREFNLSETVFLHTPDEVDTSSTSLDVNIFTTKEELPFAGHPIIGTAYLVLNHLKWTHIDTLVTKAGPISIGANETGGVKAAIPHAVRVHRQTLRDLLSDVNLSLQTQTIINAGLTEDKCIRKAELDGPVVSIVKGMTFVLVELPGLEDLAKVSIGRRLDFGAVPNLLDAGPWSESFVSRYYYVPFRSDGTTHHLRTRMVEPGFEDPATGSAACTLTSYLALASQGKQARFLITQGIEIGRKSDMLVEVSTAEIAGTEGNGLQIEGLFLGGKAMIVMSGSIVA